MVYIRAKRYAKDNTVGRERIQQFAGALVGQGASKGVFVTTSSFSSGARDYAHRVPQRIILINGEELTRLMTQYRVGGPSPAQPFTSGIGTRAWYHALRVEDTGEGWKREVQGIR